MPGQWLTAPQTEFQTAGKPIANPAFQVDNSGAPVPYSLSGTTTASAAVAANTQLTASLPAVAGQTTFITGFIFTAHVTGTNTPQVVTLSGVVGGTMNFQVGFNTTIPVNMFMEFNIPLPAAAPNTAITFSSAPGTNVPAQAVTLWGFTR